MRAVNAPRHVPYPAVMTTKRIVMRISSAVTPLTVHAFTWAARGGRRGSKAFEGIRGRERWVFPRHSLVFSNLVVVYNVFGT